MIHGRAHRAIWGTPTGHVVVLGMAVVLPLMVIALGFETRVVWMLACVVVGTGIIIRAQRAAYADLIRTRVYAPLVRGTALSFAGAAIIACPLTRWSDFAPLAYGCGLVIIVWIARASTETSRVA
jgi:hypothetical protein